jgi:glycosyltransferase involved in cell wall biosynthesis
MTTLPKIALVCPSDPTEIRGGGQAHVAAVAAAWDKWGPIYYFTKCFTEGRVETNKKHIPIRSRAGSGKIKKASIYAQAILQRNDPDSALFLENYPIEELLSHLEREKVDHVYLAHVVLQGLISPLYQRGYKVIWDMHDVMSLRDNSFFRNTPWTSPIEKMNWLIRGKIHRMVETKSWQEVHSIGLANEDEITIAKNSGCRVMHVPNTVPIPGHHWEQPTSSARILFVGTYHYKPNEDAALFLIEIYKKILSKMPSAELVLAGPNPSKAMRAAARSTQGIHIPGFVDDLEELFNSSMIFVAPISSGGGSKIKIIQAMANGIPVITTSEGASGLRVTNGRHLSICDLDHDIFSARIAEYFSNPVPFVEMAMNARSFASLNLSHDSLRVILSNGFETLLNGGIHAS